jgi:drug/metabolite transporter (DMT)-like permease
LTGLSWQHGFQYGTAAALIAAGLLYYVHKLGASGANDPPPVVLTILHSLAVTAGLIFLLASGKLQTPKGDWPANYIFLFGGFAIVGLCYFAYITQTRRPSP